jgi:hypothetical protein
VRCGGASDTCAADADLRTKGTAQVELVEACVVREIVERSRRAVRSRAPATQRRT